MFKPAKQRKKTLLKIKQVCASGYFQMFKSLQSFVKIPPLKSESLQMEFKNKETRG